MCEYYCEYSIIRNVHSEKFQRILSQFTPEDLLVSVVRIIRKWLFIGRMSGNLELEA